MRAFPMQKLCVTSTRFTKIDQLLKLKNQKHFTAPQVSFISVGIFVKMCLLYGQNDLYTVFTHDK